MVGIKKKLDRREATRERKALAAARLEKSIEKELLERLRSKAYGDAPLNVNEDVWKQVLDMDKGKDRELEMEDEESLADEEEWEEDEGGEREFVEDSDEESVGDLENYTGSEFDEFDSDEELSGSGQDFPSVLDVSDENEEGESGEEDEQPKRPRANGKAPTGNGKPALGTKRKGPQRDPKKGVKKRPPVEVQYEMETEPMLKETLRNW